MLTRVQWRLPKFSIVFHGVSFSLRCHLRHEVESQYTDWATHWMQKDNALSILRDSFLHYLSDNSLEVMCVSVLTFCRQSMEWGERTRKLSGSPVGWKRTYWSSRSRMTGKALNSYRSCVVAIWKSIHRLIHLSLRLLVSHGRLVRRHSAHWSEDWVRIGLHKTSHEHKLILYPSSSSVSPVRRLVISASETPDDCVCRSRTICDASTGFLSIWYFRIPSLHSVVSHNNF